MWKSHSNGVGMAAWSAAAAVLCTVLAQRVWSRQTELSSEALSWVLLRVILTRTGRKRDGEDALTRLVSSSDNGRQPSSGSMWAVAICVVISCVCKAETGVLLYFPALTPLLLVVQSRVQADYRSSKPSESGFLSSLFNTPRGADLISMFSVLTLTHWGFWDAMTPPMLSVVSLAALLLVYVAFLPKTVRSHRLLPRIDLESCIKTLSVRIVILMKITLVVEAIVFGLPHGSLPEAMLLALCKAGSWFFLIQTTRHASWSIATSIGTFGILATRNLAVLSREYWAVSHVLASALALGQVIYALPKQSRARSALWILSLFSIIPYLTNLTAIRSSQSSIPSSFSQSQPHPVEALVQHAKVDLQKLLETQSKTYSAAHDEYKRRYNMDPPPGFEAWYNFAISHQSPIIDDFDTMYNSISPFWKVDGQQVAEDIMSAYETEDSELWLCDFPNRDEFYGHMTKVQCEHPFRNYDRHASLLFQTLLRDLAGTIPRITFLVNHFDEPRSLVPPRRGEANGKTSLSLTHLENQPTWSAVTKFCTEQQSGGGDRTKRNVQTYDLPFVTDVNSSMDLCQHPEYSALHGLFLNPVSFSLVEGPVPILSTGAPSTMGDVLFPSPAYIEPEFKYKSEHDVDWDKKLNSLHWAGSTTGGYASDERWRWYQRQRFVQLAQNLREHYYYLQEVSGSIKRVTSSFLNGRLYNIAFTKISQCDRGPCRDQSEYFQIKPRESKDEALKSRLVFDIDGNGISGRYYKLLASKSAPLKQTLLREWHDDRLVPWVHYIPVSQTMEELPELVRYLTSTVDGQKRAAEIADQGREWFTKAFREVDMTVYMYRLMLELARVQDPERKAS